MVEILTNNLTPFFNNSHIDVKKTFQSKKCDTDFCQAWEMSNKNYYVFQQLYNQRFKNKLLAWKWFDNLKIKTFPVQYTIINNQNILTYRNTNKYKDFIKNNSTLISFPYVLFKYFIENCFYGCLTDYCISQWKAVYPKNVLFNTAHLAKLNHMTLGELFDKYQG